MDNLTYISSHLRKDKSNYRHRLCLPESLPFPLSLKWAPTYRVLSISHSNPYVHTMLISLIIRVIVPKPLESELSKTDWLVVYKLYKTGFNRFTSMSAPPIICKSL